MSEKQRLADALKERASATGWGRAAISAIADPEVVFAGNGDSPARDTAGNLLRIYKQKLDHCRARGIDTYGVVELIAALVNRAQSEVIEVQPFIGSKCSIAAFWDGVGDLVGCVTVPGRDTEGGREALEFALGKQ